MSLCNGGVGSFVAAVLVASFCPDVARAAVPEHLEWAQLMVDTVKPANNFYGDPASLTWQGLNGLSYSTNRSKCAPMVTQLLEKAYDPDFVAWFGCTSPSAASYHDAIEVEHGFTLVDSILEVQAGDIIAIRYFDAGCTDLTCGGFQNCSSSGHVALVAELPTARSATAPLVAGTLQYAVKIIDSSTSYHGAADTRYQADALGAHDQGVGEGTMRLYVDAKDPTRPVVGHSWSTSSGSAYYPNTLRDVVIGRFQG